MDSEAAAPRVVTGPAAAMEAAAGSASAAGSAAKAGWGTAAGSAATVDWAPAAVPGWPAATAAAAGVPCTR